MSCESGKESVMVTIPSVECKLLQHLPCLLFPFSMAKMNSDCFFKLFFLRMVVEERFYRV